MSNPALAARYEAPFKLLFIDDSRSQLELYRSQMEGRYHVSTAGTYEEAMAWLSSDTPDLICLDLVMPHVDGFQFLSILKGTQRFEKIPVIMVSSENDPQLVRKTFLMGAGDFVRKPYDEEELHLRIDRLLAPLPARKEAEILESRLSITAKAVMVEALLELSRTRDNETGFHLVRIQKYVDILAKAAAEHPAFRDQLTDEVVESIGELAMLHDIGKVGISDAILNKPGPLTPHEFEVMKTHTTIGAETIHQIQKRFPRYAFLEWARQIALSHHERWDGAGYPQGLKGKDIPLPARIVAIADVFDALTTKRVYKEAFTVEKAIETMTVARGEHFDPLLFDCFLDSVLEFRFVLALYSQG
jgi:putative two-component system response regulator